MPAAMYTYPIRPINGAALDDEIEAAGLPMAPMGVAVIGELISITMTRELDAAEKATLDGIVEAHVPPVPKETRPLWDIREAVLALTGPQIGAIWTDLSSGTPKKMALDTGPNAASIWVMEWSATFGTASAADKNEARVRVISFYTQDNPQYLVHPPFDPSINVPGDRPVS